ncbi:MAG: tRNA dihydrouridine synthase DusB [Desulfobulbaceae bacterium]|nr:tRNA dihydrouridine synthase DusB [Desulfobulbaceae bacterium]HIJ90183.1 tRNA dihydrouridine synthase DusB [Deltaproteobacteria bacterium]
MIFPFGTTHIKNPFVLAPMAGCTDLPFRLLCREHGAALCYSEMIDCHGLVSQEQECLDLLLTNAAEQPVIMQLYGNDPFMMGEAAAILSEQPIAGIDINMGCPMEKIVQTGAGAALMKNPRLAEKIITSVCNTSTKPVTVKIRTGWNQHTITAPEISKIAEGAGAQAIAIHGRTWTDGFTGPIDHAVIVQTMKSVAIPVFANGDITSHEEGLALLRKIGCAGVMIGRAALGAPWIFSGGVNQQPSMAYRIKTLLRHLELAETHLVPEPSLSKIRNHAWKYFRGTTNGPAIRKQIDATTTYPELRDFIHTLAERVFQQ